MPQRNLVAKELADIFRVMAHPDRIRIIEALGSDEKDVKTLLNDLELPGPRVSQHLGLLRAHRIVDERRNLRHHFYHLTQPQLADWVMDGVRFTQGQSNTISKSNTGNASELRATVPTSTGLANSHANDT